jgi:hypothetical protein
MGGPSANGEDWWTRPPTPRQPGLIAIALLAFTVLVTLTAVAAAVLSGHFLIGVAALFVCGIVLMLLGLPLWIISAVKTSRRKGV